MSFKNQKKAASVMNQLEILHTQAFRVHYWQAIQSVAREIWARNHPTASPGPSPGAATIPGTSD